MWARYFYINGVIYWQTWDEHEASWVYINPEIQKQIAAKQAIEVKNDR